MLKLTTTDKVRFMVYDDKMNSQILIKFMGRLIKDTKKKVFLILNNLKVHHSNIVSDCLFFVLNLPLPSSGHL
jgi:hypothetical protein